MASLAACLKIQGDVDVREARRFDAEVLHYRSLQLDRGDSAVRFGCGSEYRGSFRSAARKELSLPAGRLDLRSPRRLAFGSRLPARLLACSRDRRCARGHQAFRHPPDSTRLGILSQDGPRNALAAN